MATISRPKLRRLAEPEQGGTMPEQSSGVAAAVGEDIGSSSSLSNLTPLLKPLLKPRLYPFL